MDNHETDGQMDRLRTDRYKTDGRREISETDVSRTDSIRTDNIKTDGQTWIDTRQTEITWTDSDGTDKNELDRQMVDSSLTDRTETDIIGRTDNDNQPDSIKTDRLKMAGDMFVYSHASVRSSVADTHETQTHVRTDTHINSDVQSDECMQGTENKTNRNDNNDEFNTDMHIHVQSGSMHEYVQHIESNVQTPKSQNKASTGMQTNI
jgi:hypothetical protein